MTPDPADDAPAAGLLVEGLGVTYGAHVVLSEVDLALDPGTFLAVTGPSGAGKTSMLWALATALEPSSGTVRLAGRVFTDREEAARAGVVIVPQGNALSAALTAEENVLVPMLITGVAPAAALQRAHAAMELVGLEDSGRHLVDELSGGQQQRVGLARALASSPCLLLADEPTSDLDAGNRETMIAALRAQAAGGAIVVMTTHDPLAADQADGEVSLHEGHLHWVRPLARGTSEAAYGPRHRAEDPGPTS